MIEFPDQLPTEAIGIVIDKIRGRSDAGARKLAQALWNIAGYAGSQAISEDKSIFGDKELNEEDFASILESTLAHGGENGTVGFGVIPWFLISKFALKMIISFFL